ncbi:MAG: hypothetical protein HQL89_02805 [Magnetococcales bacterium]|nr:hypothetical protein [Magnetococcales bacterium]
MDDHEKMAIYLMQATPTEAKEVLERLPKGDLNEILSFMARLERVPVRVARQVRKEHLPGQWMGDGAIHGGPEQAGRFLKTAMKGKARGSMAPTTSDALPWPLLNRLPATTVARFLEKEAPRTIALVLGRLEAKQGAEIMELLPAPLQSKIAHAMMHQRSLSLQEWRAVESVIMEQCREMGLDREGAAIPRAIGPEGIATLLQRVTSGSAATVLDRLDRDDAILAERIGRRLVLFEDLILLENRDIQCLLRMIDLKDLYLALHESPSALVERFFNNMSQRIRAMNREDMESRPPPSPDEVRDARERIIHRARQLLRDGIIGISGKNRTPPAFTRQGEDLLRITDK